MSLLHLTCSLSLNVSISINLLFFHFLHNLRIAMENSPQKSPTPHESRATSPHFPSARDVSHSKIFITRETVHVD